MNTHEKSHADKNMSTICAGLQIRRTIPYNARKAVAKVRKIQAGKGVTEREDMEKAFPPVLSNLNLVVVAGNGPVEKSPGARPADRRVRRFLMGFPLRI